MSKKKKNHNWQGNVSARVRQEEDQLLNSLKAGKGFLISSQWFLQWSGRF